MDVHYFLLYNVGRNSVALPLFFSFIYIGEQPVIVELYQPLDGGVESATCSFSKFSETIYF